MVVFLKANGLARCTYLVQLDTIETFQDTVKAVGQAVTSNATTIPFFVNKLLGDSVSCAYTVKINGHYETI